MFSAANWGVSCEVPTKHPTTIADRIVDPKRDRHAFALGPKVVVIYRGRDLTPNTARILEVADQLFLLGVDADDRQAALEELLPLFGQVMKLLVSFRAVGGQTLVFACKP